MSRQTENYGMNISEGTDIVNPLVDIFPNFEIIDEAMQDNKLTGVHTATEVKSGSTHAITRSVASDIFKFTATSNWTAGDNVTIDGIAVTPVLSNGGSIPTGGFVIGSTVFCIKDGNKLTVFTNAVAGEIDADKLGGELPAYYGKASDVLSAMQSANSAQQLANSALETAEQALTKVSMAKLWTNPNISAGTFTPQSIQIDKSLYQLVMVVFRIYGSTYGFHTAFLVTSYPNTADTYATTMLVTDTLNVSVSRNFHTTPSGIEFGNCREWEGYGNASSRIRNEMMIPYEVYGFKFLSD